MSLPNAQTHTHTHSCVCAGIFALQQTTTTTTEETADSDNENQNSNNKSVYCRHPGHVRSTRIYVCWLAELLFLLLLLLYLAEWTQLNSKRSAKRIHEEVGSSTLKWIMFMGHMVFFCCGILSRDLNYSFSFFFSCYTFFHSWGGKLVEILLLDEKIIDFFLESV